MEAGQILHNNPTGLECPHYVCALMEEVRSEIARVYWNVNQKPRAAADGYEWWKEKRSYDPLPPGIEWGPYYNWAGSPEDPDWDQSQADAPNFSFEGVEIRWYKRFGRSMNVNVAWQPAQWVTWFDRIMQTLRAYETQSQNWNHGADLIPYPSKDGAIPLEPTDQAWRELELQRKIDTLKAQMNCIACVCIDVSDGKSPRFETNDWRWCKALAWVTRLGIHAMKAPERFDLHGESKVAD